MPRFSTKLASLDLRWFAVVLSCVFSLLVIALNPIPNDDAFGYLKAAELYASEGLRATLTTYGWYGYSVLIGALNPIVPGGLMTSAHVFNTLAFALLVHAFITLAGEYRQGRLVQLFAMIIILCFPTLNEMRYNLIRDFAYWGFCLAALVQLIRYHKTNALIHALGWFLAMAAAIFFRLEGLIILIVAPFALLTGNRHSRSRGFQLVAWLYLMIIAGVVLILLVFLPADVNLIDISHYAYRWYLPLLSNYPETLANAAAGVPLALDVSTQMESFTGKGLGVLMTGFVYTVIANLVMALGPAAALFLGYGFITRRQSLPGHCRGPWLFTLASTVLALFVFVSILQFLTTRYAVLTALLLLSVMPLCLVDLYTQAEANGNLKKFRRVVGVCVFYFLVDSLVSFGHSKNYINEAIAWSRENIPARETLITNNFALAYYSELVPQYDRIDTDPLAVIAAAPASGYLVVDLAHDNDAARAALALREGINEVARFANDRGDAIIIYRLAP